MLRYSVGSAGEFLVLVPHPACRVNYWLYKYVKAWPSGAVQKSHNVHIKVELKRVVHFQSVPFGCHDTYQTLKLTSSYRYFRIQTVRAADSRIFPTKLLGFKPLCLFTLFSVSACRFFSHIPVCWCDVIFLQLHLILILWFEPNALWGIKTKI